MHPRAPRRAPAAPGNRSRYASCIAQAREIGNFDLQAAIECIRGPRAAHQHPPVSFAKVRTHRSAIISHIRKSANWIECRGSSADFRVQSRADTRDRVAIEAFLTKTGAQLWIQHGFNGNAKLKKSPKFYE